MGVLGPTMPEPMWIEQARRYCSLIEDDLDTVGVYVPPAAGESEAGRGRLYLRLTPGGRRVAVSDGDGRDRGTIQRSFGLRHTLCRDGATVWTMSPCSPLLRQHTLRVGGDRLWRIHTPFFLWMSILGLESAAPRLVGMIGPTKRMWMLWVQPDWDGEDLLAAVAYLHRRWWRL